MSSDDANARRQRAQALRRQIASLKQAPDAAPQPAPDTAPAPAPPGETPNQFVHRRMRELRATPSHPRGPKKTP